MNIAGKKLSLFKHVDDTLGVVHTHMVAGAWGGFAAGLFATADGSAAFGLTTPGGAIVGNGRQVWLQIVGALFIIGWNVVWTSLIMLFIKYVLRIPLRMSDEDLMVGDDAIHGEAAYEFYGLDHRQTGPRRVNDGEKGVLVGHDPTEGSANEIRPAVKGTSGSSQDEKLD
jgi:Amt family ammonium transporter